MSRLVILDRDGTIIEERPYLSDPQAVTLLPNAVHGLRALQQEGFRLIVVSNQSGVGRGYFGPGAVERVNQRVRTLLDREGVALDGFYFCPHHPAAGCACRKPGTGLLEQAARRVGTLPWETFVVGDKECDIEMGRRAGATTVLVRTGWGRESENAGTVLPDYIVDDLLAAASVILTASAVRSRHGR